jgi:glycosyltransferase involved in cell wall biosynthesis
MSVADHHDYRDARRARPGNGDRMSDQRRAVKATVIIATRNRAAQLPETLKCLHAQAFPDAWEIIVIDNGSTDETQAVIDRWRDRLPLRGLHQPVPGKNRALNLALPEARGELLVFTDDDVVLAPSWLGAMVRAAEAWPSYDIFGGPILPIWPEATPDWIKEHSLAVVAFAKLTLPIAEGPAPEKWTPFGPNFALRASALHGERFAETIGASFAGDTLYPLGDEIEFLRRLMARGSRVVFVPSTAVGHRVEPHQLEADWLLRRVFRSGRGDVACEPDRSSTRLMGAPRYLWRLLAGAWIRSIVPLRATKLQQLERRLRLEYLLGQLYEYRRQGVAGSARR